MELEEFYGEVARLLETQHDYHEPQPVHGHGWVRHDGTIRNTYKTRWNGRDPGNGRFPGRGLVRHYGSAIHVSLSNPPLYGIYASVEEALAAIELAVAKPDHQTTEELP